ncbi:hypothetical protein [Azospirillum picis]|uniref:Uncharacterized protein n=1 Tax=Azospirillum picis TaxID=488438 RepID=A0ABU0MK44_9PROT|nr:hypothetical protein [Azospirillum picis]MBP2299933.1 hypothetical protein [Azospirillum picis]MDQ0533829.1 hypothetical protein [Azospirillum picis]
MMRSAPPRRPSAPPAPSPGRSAAQRQREIATLLMRLDAMLKQSAELAQAARERISVGGLGRYRRFSRRVRDFFALAALAQERLDAAPEEMGDLIDPMTTALERLHARMVVQFVEGSAAFFASFARVKALPIGTHEMCGVELRGVLEIRKFLDDPLYEGERGQALRVEADRIAQLIRRVMDRIPPLPDFGEEPSIGPRGTVNSPLKGPNAHLPPGRAAGRPAPPAGKAAPPPNPSTEVRSLSLDQFEDDED